MTMHGKFFWYDLMTTDTQAATKFYSEVVGWGVENVGSPGNPYSNFTVGGVPAAGLMPVPPHAEGMPPVWFGYIAVDDVDQTAARITQAGGKVFRQPTDVPDVLRFAVVSDPQGTGFMIGKRVHAMEDAPAGAIGTIGWRELYTPDLQAGLSFYEDIFGWTKVEAFDMGPMGTYQLFASGGGEAAGGMMTKPDNVPMPYWGYYITVEAINAAAERVKAGGGSVINGPHQVPGGDWVLQGLDPQGAVFALTAKAS
jgi:predicted enzyme related to lactoylglutathione lyase